MKSEWKVMSNWFANEERYIVYRILNVDELVHSGNIETYGKYTVYRSEAQALANKLNQEGENNG